MASKDPKQANVRAATAPACPGWTSLFAPKPEAALKPEAKREGATGPAVPVAPPGPRRSTGR